LISKLLERSARTTVKKRMVFSVVLEQEFDAALRAPGHKEHIWSINWRVETNPGNPTMSATRRGVCSRG